MSEIYVSTDVETDGPIPGEYSMLSFGSAAFLPDKNIVSTFTANLSTLDGAKQDPDTVDWWKSQPLAWSKAREDLNSPDEAMKNYCQWLKDLPGKPVFVGYPASFDFMFISWYLNKFAKENPFSYLALDIKTFAWVKLNRPFLEVTKSNMPEHWFDKCEKSHVALDDAIEQGLLFCNILKEKNKTS